MYVYIYIYIYICVCIHIQTYLYMYIYIYIYMFLYVYMSVIRNQGCVPVLVDPSQPALSANSCPCWGLCVCCLD